MIQKEIRSKDETEPKKTRKGRQKLDEYTWKSKDVPSLRRIIGHVFLRRAQRGQRRMISKRHFLCTVDQQLSISVL